MRARYNNGDEIGLKHAGCDGCSPDVINGVFCHEEECPEAWRDRMRACKVCGFDFRPKEKFETVCADCACESEQEPEDEPEEEPITGMSVAPEQIRKILEREVPGFQSAEVGMYGLIINKTDGTFTPAAMIDYGVFKGDDRALMAILGSAMDQLAHEIAMKQKGNSGATYEAVRGLLLRHFIETYEELPRAGAQRKTYVEKRRGKEN